MIAKHYKQEHERMMELRMAGNEERIEFANYF